MAICTFLFTDYYYRQWIFDHKSKQISKGLDSFIAVTAKEGMTRAQVCESLYRYTTLRFTLIDSTGVVLCDSLHGEIKMENHLHRPEIEELDRSDIGFSRRKSATSADTTLYGAKRLMIENQPHYYIRAGMSLEDFSKTIFIVWRSILLILLPALFLLSAVLLWQFYNMDQRQQIAHQKLKGDLVANISHEVRTPLTAITGYLQLLKSSRSDFTLEQVDYLQRMQISVKQLGNLFSDVLELSLLENEMPLAYADINSRDMINCIIKTLSSSYLEKRISFVLEIEDFDFSGDGKFIEMVFKNILDNACKYSHSQGEVRVIFKRDGERCRFICRDKGKGIAASLENRIFERFFRGERDASIAGTGLGLAIAKHAVERHQGRLWYASIENQGTSFFVELPLQPNS